VDVTEWEPATDAEVAMRDALRTDDQESYFRILAGVDLLLPVSADALAGLAPLGWGTWSTGGRTHVLAFTSPSALQACLADYTGSARRVPYKELAETWPNLEWWLAVNPGLPIEGYLPAWFVAQLARGDLRLPTRGPARDAGQANQEARDGAPAPDQGAAAPASVSPAGGPSAAVGPVGLPLLTPGPVRSSGLPSRVPAGAQPASAAAPGSTGPDAGAGQALREDRPGLLPTRTPMAQTPPLPDHLSPPGPKTSGPPVDSGPSGAGAGGPLPRRHVPPPSERSVSMAAAAQALSGMRSTSPASASAAPTSPAQPGMQPPIIPGSEGADRAPAGSPTGRTLADTVPDTAEATPSSPAAPAVQAAEPTSPSPTNEPAKDDDFVPANDVERELYEAADSGSTDRFLSTLLLATVLVPVAHNSRPGSVPGEPGFAFRTEDVDGEQYLVVFTSRDRLAEHFAEPTRTAGVRFYELIRNWPDPAWSFAVNPGSPVGAKYPGPQVIALANWAREAGLGEDPAETDDRAAPVPVPQRVSDAAQHATVMQKTVPPAHVDFYTDRGYDRVAGFVHRANEVEHLRTPAELFAALGLVHEGSPFQPDAKEAFVLRWPAYRPSLYRIPYGGQSEQALRAMDGWVIERPPFRGNGFAPGEGRDVIAEFKVDSVRLPHGAQLWRLDADGTERMIAIFDADAPVWRRVGEQ
jgi:SseB protein N-terminal domain